MVYKKYIKRRVDGKTKLFGPYYYESYRDKQGNVKTKYIAGPEDLLPKEIISQVEKKRKLPSPRTFNIFLACFLAFIILGFVFFQFYNYLPNESNLRISNIADKISGSALSIYSSVSQVISGLVISEEAEVPSQELEAPAEETSPGEELQESPIEEVQEAPPEQLVEEISTEEEVEKESEEQEVTEETEEPIEEPEEEPLQEEIEETNETEPEIEEPAEELINETTEISAEENITEEIIEEPENLTEINETIMNETKANLTETNITISNVTEINITETNITISNITETNITIANETLVNETLTNLTALNITTKNAKIVMGRPVKWVKTIKVEQLSANLTLELPKQAENITIKTGQEARDAEKEIDDYENLVTEADRQEIVSGDLTGMVSLDIQEKQGILTRFWNFIRKLTITGNVISEQETQESITETQDSKIVDLFEIAETTQEQDIAVEYYTESPSAVEENLTNGKKITISAPDELEYKNVLAYSELDNKIKIEEKSKIKLYWYTSREDLETAEKAKQNKKTQEPEQPTENNLLTGNVIENKEGEKVPQKQEHTPTDYNTYNAKDYINVSDNKEENKQVPQRNESTFTDYNKNNTNNYINVSANDDVESALVAQRNEQLPHKQQPSPVSGFESQDENPNSSSNFQYNNQDTKVRTLGQGAYTTKEKQIIKTEVSFDAYDLDEDGNIDYIEWNVPHLSAQVYEIIYITKAVHLDSEREVISDIYSQVKEKDGNWSESIAPEEYIRVTFEQALDKTKDITLYAKSATGNPAEIEVYRENNNELITTFTNISEENWYKIYLSSLDENESYDTFDLKILNSAVEIDYIVDPQANLSSTVYQCGSLDSPGTYTLNQSISSVDTCITINADNVTLDGNGHAINFNTGGADNVYGVYITSANHNNITIKNFALINDSSTAYDYNDIVGIYADYILDNSLIQNNSIYVHGYWDMGGSHGIYIDGDNNSILNNSITVEGDSGVGGGYGIYIYGISSGSVISGNTINSYYSSGIVFGGTSSNSIINGSNIINAGTVSCSDTTYYCSGIVYASTSTNDVIDGNEISALQSGAFDINLLSTATNLNLTNQIISNYNIADLSNISFINSTYGTINLFNMNGTGTNLIKNATSDIKIGNNSAYVNSSQTGLNKSANITLYDAGTYTIPGILREGVLCSSDICSNLQSLGGGDYSFSVTGWSNYSITDVSNLTTCGYLTTANQVYTLGADISTTGTCFTIQANNVTLDMNGFNITGDDGGEDYGVYVDGYNQTTIKNGEIYDLARAIYLSSGSDNTLTNITANSNTEGIYLSSSSNNIVTNITTNLNADYGIYLLSSSNNNISQITANSNTANYGIGLSSSNNNTITNIIANSNSGGIYLGSSSNNNQFTNITANSNTYYGIVLSSSSNNILTNLTANSNPQQGIYISSSSNNTFTNNNIWNCTGTLNGCIRFSNGDNNTISEGTINSSSKDLIYLETNSDNNLFQNLTLLGATKNDTFLTTTSVNNIFTNVSYTLSKEYVASGSELIRKGYFISVIANVTYIGNASRVIAGENASLKNSTGSVLNSNVSIANGQATLSFASPQLYTFYTNNGGTRTSGIYLYTTNSTSPYLAQTTDFTWANLLNDDGAISGETQDVRMHYSTYTLAGTQTLHDVYTNINDSSVFINLSSASVPCRYVANCSITVTGTMIIEGCVLEMSSIAGGYLRTLFVSDGGNLIMNYSNLTAYTRTESLNYKFYSVRGSSLTLKNSYIDYIGTTDSDYARGLEINSTSLIFDNITMSINKHAVSLWAPNLIINNSKISGSTDGTYGDNIKIRAEGAKIVNCNISNPAGGRGDIAIDANMDVTVVNSNYSNVGFGGTGATLTRSWWYQAFVNDTAGNNVSGANVTAYNVSDSYQFNLTTNASGWTTQKEIIEYIQDSAGDKTYYSNYTIYARNSSYVYIASSSINVTSQQNIEKDVFTIDKAPVVSLISASPIAYTYNATDDNTISNCSLILGGSNVAIDTNIDNLGGTETISYSAGDGTHTYYMSCVDELGNTGNSTTSTNTIITTTVTTTGGGGGGGTRTISLKINVPAPISLYEKGTVEIPIILENTGQTTFYNLNLTASVFINGVLRKDIILELDKSYFSSIVAGKKENVTIKADINSDEITTYNIVINTTSKTPQYTIDNKAYINFVGENATGIRKMIIFTEEMIVENPECLELREMIEEAERLRAEGKYQEAIAKSQQAIEACKASIEGPKRPSVPRTEEQQRNILIYLAIGIGAAILFGILFNLIRRLRFRKKS